jgi:hypothetical protein
VKGTKRAGSSIEKFQQGWCSVECAVAPEEGGVGDEAAPGLADDGGADEALRLVRR